MIAFLTPLLYGLGPAALLLAMVIVFAETGLLVGLLLPGDSLLFTVGILVATGVIHLPLVLVAACLFGAAAAGDQVGYLLGRRFGPRVFNRSQSRLLSRAHAERAETFFAKPGSKAVILARFVPVARTFTPVVAGVARMPRRTFTAVNLAGAALWAVGLLVAGYFLGGVPIVAAHVELFAVAMVALSLVPAAVALVRHWISARREVGFHAGRERDRRGARMNLRRAFAAMVASLALSATLLFADGSVEAGDARTTGSLAAMPFPAPVHRLDRPAEVRVLMRSLGLPVAAVSGRPEWSPATASAIDAHGGRKALAARLSLEYAGAVSGPEVGRVVRRVTRALRRGHVSAARLLDVAEAQCRRELTDRLARGVTTARAV